MALINPNTGSSKFNVIVRREAVVSLAGEEPVIVSESEEFSIKLVSDAISGEEISTRDLQEVPDEEIGEDGIWVKAQAAKLKAMSQEELIAMVLKLQSQVGEQAEVVEAAEEVVEETAEEVVEEVAEEPVEEEAPKPKRRKKKPAPVEEEPESIEEVHTAAEEVNEDELDVEF